MIGYEHRVEEECNKEDEEVNIKKNVKEHIDEMNRKNKRNHEHINRR